MAYYLNYSFFSGTKYIAVNIPASTSNTGRPLQIEWEIEFEARKNGTEFIIASDTAITTAVLFFIRTGSDFEFRSTSNANWLVTTGATTTNFTIYRIRSTFDGTTRLQQLYINGSLVASRNPSTAAIPAVAAFFGLNNVSTRNGDFKYFKFTDFVTPANNRFYDANASGGTGTVLPDTINSANNGTQQGTWPTDNSEWVFYSSGASNTVTVSATLPKITGSLTLNEINPSYAISVNGQLPKITGAVTLNEINPVFTVAVAGQLPKLTGSIALNQFASNRQAVVNGVLPKLTGAVTLNRIQPNNQASVSGQLPRITASITLRVPESYPAANPNDYTVSAYLSTDSTYTARLSESSTINAIISASSTFNARLN